MGPSLETRLTQFIPICVNAEASDHKSYQFQSEIQNSELPDILLQLPFSVTEKNNLPTNRSVVSTCWNYNNADNIIISISRIKVAREKRKSP